MLGVITTLHPASCTNARDPIIKGELEIVDGIPNDVSHVVAAHRRGAAHVALATNNTAVQVHEFGLHVADGPVRFDDITK